MKVDFPFIFTFYSFKGGVGRSVALLNAAYCLVGRGRNVLILDMDLEAPGIGRFLRDNQELAREPQKDVIDLMSAVIAAPDSDGRRPLAELSAVASPFIAPVKAEKLDVPSLTPRLGVRGRLDVITGRADGDYCTRLDRLRLGQRSQEDLVEYGEVLRKYLKGLRIEVPPLPGTEDIPGIGPTQEPYDYVLVDSRTGVTEAGGLCLGPLSDRLVVFTGLNHQNVRGTADFLKEIGLETREWFTKDTDEPWDEAHKPASDGASIPKGIGPKPTLIVASPVPIGDMERQKDRIGKASEDIGPVSMKITYHPQLGFYETNFVRDYPDEPITIEYRLLTDFVMSGSQDNPPQLEERSHLEWYRKEYVASIDSALRLTTANPEIGEGLLMRLSLRLWERTYDPTIPGDAALCFTFKLPDECKAVHRLYAVWSQSADTKRVTPLIDWGNFLSDQAKTQSEADADRFFSLAYDKYAEAVAVKDAPDNFEVLSNWGCALLDQARNKQGEQAQALYRKASEVLHKGEAINEGSCAYNLACLAARLRDGADSKKWLEIALEKDKTIKRRDLVEDPDLDSVKGALWFSELLTRIGNP